MNQKLIQAVHIYVLLIIFSGFMVHVLSLPILLSAAKRDAWVSALASAVPVTIWMLLVFNVYKQLKHRDILSFLQKSLNRWVYTIFSSLFCIYFFMTSLITLKFTLFWAKTNYTFDKPNFVVVLLFSVICYYSSAKGIRTISSMAFLVLPMVVIFGFLVGLGNTPNKNYELLFPVFENGYSDFFKGLAYACSSLFEVFFILFITPHLKNKLKLKWLILVGIILVALSVGPLAGAIAEFGSVEAEKMRNPAYEEWKLLTIGVHITRLDFLSIFQWLSGAFIRISLSLFIAAKILPKQWTLPVLYFLLFLAGCIPWDAVSFFYNLKTYYYPLRVVFEIVIVLFLLLLIKLKGDQHD
jgi:spore germination protein KB